MGYQIHYGQTMVKRFYTPGKNRVILRRIAVPFLILIGMFGGICLLRLDSLQKALLPGNPEVTKSAFCNLVTDLKEGEQFEEAITAFCREIIENGNIPQ